MCEVVRDHGLNEGDVNILRHRILQINIMQISGFFKVDQPRFERDGVSHEIDGQFCMDLIANDGNFSKMDIVPDKLVYDKQICVFRKHGVFVFETYGNMLENVKEETRKRDGKKTSLLGNVIGGRRDDFKNISPTDKSLGLSPGISPNMSPKNSVKCKKSWKSWSHEGATSDGMPRSHETAKSEQSDAPTYLFLKNQRKSEFNDNTCPHPISSRNTINKNPSTICQSDTKNHEKSKPRERLRSSTSK